eukprot:30962-Pelagococcus_subviridis.AAC.9
MRLCPSSHHQSVPLHRKLLRPLLRRLQRGDLVHLPRVRDLLRERVVRVRRAQQRLNGQQHRSYLQRGRPLILQDVQTDPPQVVYVRVVDLRQEPHLRRGHRVLLREEQLELEDAALVRGVSRAADHDAEVPQVVLLRLRADPGRGLAQEALGLLSFAVRRVRSAAGVDGGRGGEGQRARRGTDRIGSDRSPSR